LIELSAKANAGSELSLWSHNHSDDSFIHRIHQGHGGAKPGEDRQDDDGDDYCELGCSVRSPTNAFLVIPCGAKMLSDRLLAGEATPAQDSASTG